MSSNNIVVFVTAVCPLCVSLDSLCCEKSRHSQNYCRYSLLMSFIFVAVYKKYCRLLNYCPAKDPLSLKSTQTFLPWERFDWESNESSKELSIELFLTGAKKSTIPASSGFVQASKQGVYEVTPIQTGFYWNPSNLKLEPLREMMKKTRAVTSIAFLALLFLQGILHASSSSPFTQKTQVPISSIYMLILFIFYFFIWKDSVYRR